MPRSVMEFWFDFASTYSYLTAQRIDELASGNGIRVRWMPFLLGPIFAGQGWTTSPFNIYPAKGAYMWRDMERLCDLHDLPLQQPEVFPQFALLASRVALAAESEPWQPAFCRAIFMEEYGRGGDITSQEAVHAALTAAQADADAWLAAAQTGDVKQRLKEREAVARRKGIFGAPSFVTPDNELFWGDDRLEQALGWILKRR